MTIAKKELEERISRAVDSICTQLKENTDLRPPRIFLYNGEMNDLEYFKIVLSERFPFDSYSPDIIIGNTKIDYSIDVSFFLRGFKPAATS
ncbi:MAG: hypothetical protein AABX16_05235 [Nanoarchaeota archaeon]